MIPPVIKTLQVFLLDFSALGLRRNGKRKNEKYQYIRQFAQRAEGVIVLQRYKNVTPATLFFREVNACDSARKRIH